MAWIRSGYYKCKKCGSSFYVTISHTIYPIGKGNKRVNIKVSPRCVHCGGRVVSIKSGSQIWASSKT